MESAAMTAHAAASAHAAHATDRRTRLEWPARIVPVALALAAALAVALDAGLAGAAGPSSAPASANQAARAESIPGKTVKQVVLSEKAAGRAGIQQGAVNEGPVVATQMFGALIVDAASSTGDKSGDKGRDKGADKGGARALALRVGVSPTENARIDRTKPARVYTLETRPALRREVVAAPMDAPVAEALRSGMAVVYYSVPAGDVEGLGMGKRVRAELQLQGSGETRKTVPYASILYDAKGDAWVYVVSAPLTYHRERVDIERVAGDRAVLKDGPAAGTPVVTVGVSLLYGVEVFGK